MCNAGSCEVKTCKKTYDNCDKNDDNGCETNLTTSSLHCGACENKCSAGETCVNAVCKCKAGYVLCGGSCVNPQEDVNYCGALDPCAANPGVKCSSTIQNATLTCALGVCGFSSCKSGFGNCDNLVSNGCETSLRVSNEHCGKCNNVCPPDTTCVTGACKCGAEGQVLCSNVCIDPSTNSDHCGAKGNCNTNSVGSGHYKGSKCLPDQLCVDGVCSKI